VADHSKIPAAPKGDPSRKSTGQLTIVVAVSAPSRAGEPQLHALVNEFMSRVRAAGLVVYRHEEGRSARRDDANAADRFWVKTRAAQNGCIEWIAGLGTSGYGRFCSRGKSMPAHRFAYLLRHGSIPSGYSIDHLCRNTRCVNPDHLEAVTHRENVLRSTSHIARNAKATHCIHGHELSGYNLIVISTTGYRSCRACRQRRDRIRRARQRV
jgi:hypothetical protein